jgi:hypothetical protein
MKAKRNAYLCGILAASVLAAGADAIVPDLRTKDWQGVGRVGRQWPGSQPHFNGTGVAIGDRWVLTCRHLLLDSPTTFIPDSVVRFRLEGKGGVTPRRVHFPPQLMPDLALLEFAPNTFTTWYEPYRKDDEKGKLVAVVGYGYTFRAEGGTLRQVQNSDGVRRAGFNRVSVVTDLQLRMDFDAPGAPDAYGDGGPVDKECIVAGHDSGGPSLIRDTDGKWKVAGIHEALADGVTFGGRFYDVRVSRFIGWLDSVMGRSASPVWYSSERCPSFESLLWAAPRTMWIQKRLPAFFSRMAIE